MPDPRVNRYLGPLEAGIMAALWDLPRASVREVTERLNRERTGKPLAYTTVMTVMSRLAEKGLLLRQLAGKTYDYRATCSQDEFLAQVSNERVAALVEEFGELALTQFLNQLERLDPEHRERLRDLAKEQRGTEEP